MATDPFNNRTAMRLRAIIGAQKTNLSAMGKQLGKTRGYIDTRLRCVVPISAGDLQPFGNYLGYTPEELVADHFTLHEPTLAGAAGQPANQARN